jgi:DNA-directed RNA polymerase I subunit RPA1
MMTNGSNLPGMWAKSLQASRNPVVQLDNIYTNDIYAMLTHYGVEAARTVLIKEISSVFGSYNIDVDFRHLELIADYMVGVFTSFDTVIDLTLVLW